MVREYLECLVFGEDGLAFGALDFVLGLVRSAIMECVKVVEGQLASVTEGHYPGLRCAVKDLEVGVGVAFGTYDVHVGPFLIDYLSSIVGATCVRLP